MEHIEYGCEQNVKKNDAGTLQAKLSEHNNNFDSEFVLCPVCGFDCVHIVNVSVLSGDDDYVSNAVVISSLNNVGFLNSLKTYNRNRNLSVLTEFICEAGHGWSEYLAFHKGSTYKTVVLGK